MWWSLILTCFEANLFSLAWLLWWWPWWWYTLRISVFFTRPKSKECISWVWKQWSSFLSSRPWTGLSRRVKGDASFLFVFSHIFLELYSHPVSEVVCSITVASASVSLASLGEKCNQYLTVCICRQDCFHDSNDASGWECGDGFHAWWWSRNPFNVLSSVWKMCMLLKEFKTREIPKSDEKEDWLPRSFTWVPSDFLSVV